MFTDLLSTLTVKKWLTIGAIVAIAVISGYFILSTQTGADKGNLALIGVNSADKNSPFKPVEQQNKDNALVVNPKLDANQLGLTGSTQPAASDVTIGAEEFIPVLKFTVIAESDLQSPISQIALTSTGTANINDFEFKIANGVTMSEVVSASKTLSFNSVNLKKGENEITILARAKNDAIATKILTINLASANAFTLAEGKTILADPKLSFPIESAPLTIKAAAIVEEPLQEVAPPNASAIAVSLDDTIPSREIPLGDTPTAVFGVSVSPAESAPLNSLVVSLDAGVENALDFSKIQAGIYIQSGDSAERSITSFAHDVDGTFTFNTFKDIGFAANQTTRVIVKTKIADDAPAGKNFRFKITRANLIALGNDKTVTLPDGGLIGAVMTTAAAPAQPVVEECSQQNLCYHQAHTNEILPTTLPVGSDTPTRVLDFSFDPSPGASLQSLVVTLDTGVTPPLAPVSRIRAYLFTIDAQDNEVAIDGNQNIDGQANGSFTFSNINRPLFAESPTRFIVKARILPPAAAGTSYVEQKFKFIIKDAAHAVLNAGHSFEKPEPIEGAVMSIQAQSCPAGQNPNAEGNACVATLECSDNQHLNDTRTACIDNTEVLAPVTDICPNGPDGIQEVIPRGMNLNADGTCTPVVAEAPQCGANQHLNNDQTACIDDTPPEEQIFACSNIGMFNYDGPARPDIPQNTCIPCESALYISSNKSCEEPVVSTADTQNSNATAGSNGDPANTRSAAFEGASTGSVAGNMSLAQSQRLTYVPERGNTGPDIFIYIIGGGFAPAIAYSLRRMKK